MNKNFSSIEVDCECGACHELLSLIVLKNNIEKLVDYIDSAGAIVVRLFVDKAVCQHELINTLRSALDKLNIKLIITEMSVTHAEVYRANSILYCDEEFIIVFGNSPLIELIKFYACSVDVEYSIILCTEFYDFTFSKFARVYDGINYGFYSVKAPSIVVYIDAFAEKLDMIKYISYLKQKQIAFFENLLIERLDEGKLCRKINSKLKKIVSLSDKITSVNDAFYSLVFMGRAMSFFNGTKGFYGAELEIANMLEVLTKKDFLDCYNIASVATRKIYFYALSANLKILNFDINKRINKIKSLLKLPATKCLTFIKKQKSMEKLSRNIKIVHALKYMLLGAIEEMNDLFLCDNVNPKLLAEAIYLSPEFTIKYTFLNFIRDLGFLENLV